MALFSKMDNTVAKFMLNEVNKKVQGGAKRLNHDTVVKLRILESKIAAGSSLFGNDALFLQQLHERCTEMRRLKW